VYELEKYEAAKPKPLTKLEMMKMVFDNCDKDNTGYINWEELE